MAANSAEQSLQATISVLTDLQRSPALQQGGSGGGLQKARARTDAGLGGATAGMANGGGGVLLELM